MPLEFVAPLLGLAGEVVIVLQCVIIVRLQVDNSWHSVRKMARDTDIDNDDQDIPGE